LTYKEETVVNVDRHQAKIVNDAAAQVPSSPERAVFVLLDSKVLLITAEFGNETEFNDVIASLKIQ